MTILERLKVELSHKDYFTDVEYTMYLQENNLTVTNEYNKLTMQRNLLLTVVDILEAVGNDIDLMRKIDDGTTGLSVSEAYKLLQSRIQDLKNRIASIPIDTEEDNDSCVTLLFTKGRR